MKLNSSVFNRMILTCSLVASATMGVDAKAEAAEIYLDTLDADGHLSILQAQANKADSNAQKVAEKPQAVAIQAVDTIVEEKTAKVDNTKAKYVQATYLDKAADTYGKDHSGQSYSKVEAASKTAKAKAKADEKDQGFISKHTTEVEFTFAILIIVIGLIASERIQRAQQEQMQAVNESSNSH